MEMKDLKSYMGKYAEIALYDDGAGTAEIIDVNEEKIKLMWVQYTSCYDCQVYGAEIYFRPTTYGINDICNIGRAKITSRKEADFLRAESLKNVVDIFRRYYAL